MGEWKPFHEGCGNNKRISNEVRGILEDKNLKYFKAMTQDAAENVKLTFLRRIDARISLSVGRTEEGSYFGHRFFLMNPLSSFKGPSGDWQEVHVLGKKDLSTFCNLGLVSCDHF